jgi:hypothetical protein
MIEETVDIITAADAMETFICRRERGDSFSEVSC